MKNQDMPNEVKKLLEKAEEYAELALENFILEEVIERVPETDKISTIINAAAEWSAKSPLGFMAYGHWDQLELHFLFPNMSPEERELLNRLAIYADSVRSAKMNHHPLERDIQNWTAAKSKVEQSGIEKKLTAVQIAILDSEKFTPKEQK